MTDASISDVTVARTRTRQAFDAVRSRVRIGDAFTVAAHAALGGAFGAVLTWMGEGGPWMLAALATGGAIGSGLWALARLPIVAAGRLIERRFPDCRNVLVTADELLAGSMAVSEDAAARVFQRAADVLSRIEPVRAAMIAQRVSVSTVIILASVAFVIYISRALST